MPITLIRLFARRVISTTLLVWLVFIALLTLLEMLRQAGDNLFGEAALFAFLRAPFHAAETLLFACLIGSAVAMQRMASSNEMVGLRATGLSPWQILAHLSLIAVVFAAAHLIIGETLLSRSADLTRGLKNESLSADNLWLRNGDDFIHINHLRPDGVLEDVTIYRFGGDDDLQTMLFAARAEFDNNRWHLRDIITVNERERRHFAKDSYPLPLLPESFSAFTRLPRDMSLAQAARAHRQLARAGQRDPALLQTIWQRLLIPPSLILLVAMGIWFIGRRPPQSGAAIPALITALAGGVYYLAVKITAQTAATESAPALLILPPLILAAIILKGARAARYR